MPEGPEGRHATEARSEPWCSIDDVLEGPVSAVLYTERTAYACRIGKSPKYELLRAVRDDGELKRCLALTDSPGVLDVSLLVDGEGRVEVEPADDDEGAALNRCAARLNLLHAMKLGCRWKVQLSLGAFSL